MASKALAIFGITGRMGQSLLRAMRETDAWSLSGAVASPQNRRLGQDAVEVGEPLGVPILMDAARALSNGAGHKAAVAVDFSSSVAVPAHARACAAARVPLLVGTTALDAAALKAIDAAAAQVPVLLAANTSLGVGVLTELVRMAARALPQSYDVEIHEAHHRMKRDAPSGTALKLGEAVAEVRGQVLADVAAYDRHGTHASRAPGSIGFSVVRAGDIVGEHTVILAGAGERLEITHRATDRDVFARGALNAAEWLIGQSPGTYSMQDVLRH